MTSAVRPAAWWRDQASIASWHGCVPAKSARPCASMPHGSPVTDATGTICWSCAVWSRQVYDPCRPNDRLLLGMKGSISEFELGVLRARMFEPGIQCRQVEFVVDQVVQRELEGAGLHLLGQDHREEDAVSHNRLVARHLELLASTRCTINASAPRLMSGPSLRGGRTVIAQSQRPILGASTSTSRPTPELRRPPKRSIPKPPFG